MPKIHPDRLPHYTASRRMQILDAATQVIASHGFQQATIHKIAVAAGLADGTIYRYFENKDALLLGLLDRLNESEKREIDLSQLSGDSTRDLLTAYLEHRLGLMWENAELFRALLPELMARPALRERYLAETITPTLKLGGEAITRLAAEQGLTLTTPLRRARLVAGAIWGVLLLHLLGDDVGDLPSMAAEIADLLLCRLEKS